MAIWFFGKGLNILKHSIFVSWLLYLSICIGLIIYYWFYTWYIPVANFKTDVTFELKIQKELNIRSIPPYELESSIDLFDQNGNPILQIGQEYTFKLDLEVAESDANFDIGLFGITADIYNLEGVRSSTFRTTGTLKYRSMLLRYALTLFHLPFFLFGSREQKQTLNIILKDGYSDNDYVRTSRIVIRIHEKLQFYKAKLYIDAKFTGLKYYFYHWYYITSLIICSSLIAFTFIILVTNSYDIKSYLMGFISNLTKPKNTKNIEKNLDICKTDSNSKYTFIRTTTKEIQNLLDFDYDANVLIGIENFYRITDHDKDK